MMVWSIDAYKLEVKENGQEGSGKCDGQGGYQGRGRGGRDGEGCGKIIFYNCG